MSLPDQSRLIEELSYADPSVGWCVMIGSDSGLLSAYFDDAIAEQIWTDVDDVTAGFLMPEGAAVAVPGGYRISGRWKLGSGSTHADVIIAGCLVVDESGALIVDSSGQPTVRMTLAPAECFEILDTWHTTGLAGSGSNDDACADLFVPAEHTFALSDRPRRAGPLHAFNGAFLTNMAGVPLGLARRAIDEATGIVRQKFSRRDGVAMRELPRVRDAIAEAQRQHRSAQAYVDVSLERAWAGLVAAGRLALGLDLDGMAAAIV